MIFLAILMVAHTLAALASAGFLYQSLREGEPRAPKVAAAILGLCLLAYPVIVYWPAGRVALALIYGCLLAATAGLLLCKPGRLGASAWDIHGAARGRAERFDERDVVFARNRGLPAGSERYQTYYGQLHPEREAGDAARRAVGGPLGRPGSIDGGYPPLLSMLKGSFAFPDMVGTHARLNPEDVAAKGTYAAGQKPAPFRMDPAEAAAVLKGWAKRLGADLVGVARVDPRWAYSHRGEIFYDNWEEWGGAVGEPLPYAVVVATQMEPAAVAAAPHTPAVVESGFNYAKGAFITTILAQWFANLGYKAVAEHNRHYDLLLVPLAVDAGLGELGRQGYLIADKYGPRVRLFAVQTDMPLAPDAPLDLGAAGFCAGCLKCAESCPSKSIPLGGKEEVNGSLRWKLNEDTCFDYWGKVGTDCCVCMAICPFSRPDQGLHKAVRWLLKRSSVARRVLPPVDNFIYGKRWRPRPPGGWMSYPKGRRPEDGPGK